MPQYRKGRQSPWMVQVADVAGKIVTRSFAKRDDAFEYFLLMRRNRARVRAGLEPVRVAQKFGSFAQAWIVKRKAQYPESTTVGEESKLRNTWLPLFRDREMHTITTAEIVARLGRLISVDRLSPATANRHRALLSVLFEAARRDKVLSGNQNPVADIPVRQEKRKVQTVWTQDQIQLYLGEAYKEGFVYGALATLLVFGGPRVGECLALRWCDILWDLASIVVGRIRESHTGKLIDRTKGQGEGGSYQLILLPVVAKALTLWRAQTRCSRDKDLIFVHWHTPINYWRFENLHHHFVERARLPRITPHGLRHAFASHAQRRGLTTADLQGLLGHASIQTTERYTHKDLRDLAEKAQRIGFGAAEILFPPQPLGSDHGDGVGS